MELLVYVSVNGFAKQKVIRLEGSARWGLSPAFHRYGLTCFQSDRQNVLRWHWWNARSFESDSGHKRCFVLRFRSTLWLSRAVWSVNRETSGADRWNRSRNDCIGSFHWFPVAADRISRLSQKVDRGLERSWSDVKMSMHHRWLHNQCPPCFSVFHCPLGLGELKACPFIPLCCLPTSYFVCLVFFQTTSSKDE